jgi:hypothetical protein
MSHSHSGGAASSFGAHSHSLRFKSHVERDFYLLPLPDEVFHLFDALVKLSPSHPCGSLVYFSNVVRCRFCKGFRCADALLEAAGIQFVGPFEALQLLAKHSTRDRGGDDGSDGEGDKAPLRIRSRFYYDPPEVLTIARFPSENPKHWGYFRDEPTSLPLFVAESDSARGNTFKPLKDTLFGAVLHLLSSASGSSATDCLATITAAAKHAGVDAGSDSACKSRAKAVIAPTLSGLGIVVPYDKATEVGFRPLAHERKQLLLLFAGALSGSESNKRKLEELRTFAHIANDECDFGNGYLLGLEFWAYSPDFTDAAVEHLSVAYMLLNRGRFGDILTDIARGRDATDGGRRTEVPNAFEASGGKHATLKRKRTVG